MTTAASHSPYCPWNFEQYPWECACGASRPKADWFDAYVRKCEDLIMEANRQEAHKE